MSNVAEPPEPAPRPDRSKVVDLGSDHKYSLVGDIDGNTIGLIFDHPAKETKGGPVRCRGSVFFDVPAARAIVRSRHLWKLISLEPLTLSPSLQCTACGDHGFIRNDRWQAA